MPDEHAVCARHPDLVKLVVEDRDERRQRDDVRDKKITEMHEVVVGSVKDGKVVPGLANAVLQNTRTIGWIGKAIWIPIAAFLALVVEKVWP